MTIIKEIEQLTKKSIRELQFKKRIVKFDIPEIKIERPNSEIYGDYSTNIAMVISKNAQKNPEETATLIKSEIQNLKPKILKKVEVVKPGFINFFISEDIITTIIKKTLDPKNFYGIDKIGQKKTIIIDYSSPNIAKPFNIGHLRSTIIGQVICNLYKFLGYKVISDNHLGDWGTQFGKLIFAIKKWGDEEKINKNPIKELNMLYVKFHKKEASNSDLKEEGRKWFKKLENNNKEAKIIWKKCVEWSLKEFNRIYKILGVKFDIVLGESFYQPMAKEIIKEAVEKKVAMESNGAIIIDFSKNTLPPLMIQKSDGSTLYSSRDLATIKYRLNRFKPFKIIYETGVDQELYFKQLFSAAEFLGWIKKKNFFHLAHGLMRLKSGKMSTRKGEVILLRDVLDEAIKRAGKIIEEKNTDLSEKEKKEVAESIGIGAIKYNDLRQHYSKDIIFDWEKVLNLNGNSGPYLQYTYARAYNILKKSGMHKKKIKTYEIEQSATQFKEKKDIEILKLLSQFPEIIEESAYTYSPNLLCNFLFKLSQEFNNFYETSPILKEKKEELKKARLILVYVFCETLKNGLYILGIKALERI